MCACRYEVFLDLSVPLTKEGKGGMLNFFSKNTTPSIEDCLHAFTTDEVMQVIVYVLLLLSLSFDFPPSGPAANMTVCSPAMVNCHGDLS